MKVLTLAWLVGAAALGAAAAAETNALRPLTLDELLQTRAAGTYRLSPALSGKRAVVVATGAFTQPEPPVSATNRYKLKFDTAVVTPARTIGNVGPHAIARSEKDGGFSA